MNEEPFWTTVATSFSSATRNQKGARNFEPCSRHIQPK